MLLAVASSVLLAKKQYDLAYRRIALLLMAKSLSETQSRSDQKLTCIHLFISMEDRHLSVKTRKASRTVRVFSFHWSGMLVFLTIM